VVIVLKRDKFGMYDAWKGRHVTEACDFIIRVQGNSHWYIYQAETNERSGLIFLIGN